MAKRPQFTERALPASREAVDTLYAWVKHHKLKLLSQGDNKQLYRAPRLLLNRKGLNDFHVEVQLAENKLRVRAFLARKGNLQKAQEISVKGLRGAMAVPAGVALNPLFRALKVERIVVPAKVGFFDWSYLLGLLLLSCGVVGLLALGLATMDILPYAKAETSHFAVSNTLLAALLPMLVCLATALFFQRWIVKRYRTLLVKFWALVLTSSMGFYTMAVVFLVMGFTERNHLNRIAFYCLDTPQKELCAQELAAISKRPKDAPFPESVKREIAQFSEDNPNDDVVQFWTSQIPALK